MLEMMWSKENTPALLVGVQTCTTTLEINVVIYQKTGNQPTSEPSDTSLGCIPKGCSIITQGCLLNYAHCSFVYNSQNL